LAVSILITPKCNKILDLWKHLLPQGHNNNDDHKSARATTTYELIDVDFICLQQNNSFLKARSGVEVTFKYNLNVSYIRTEDGSELKFISEQSKKKNYYILNFNTQYDYKIRNFYMSPNDTAERVDIESLFV
jgi:hypothetical protein